jgi:hypothetical protein
MRTWIAVLVFAAFGVAAFAAESNRVLLIHDGAKPIQPLVTFLHERGGFEVTIVDQTQLPTNWGEFRAVLGYVHNKLLEPTELAIIDYTKKGGRFVALHHMISSGKADNKYYFDFLGVQLDAPKQSKDPVEPGAGYGWYTGGKGEPGVVITLVNLAPKHFIVAHEVKWGDTAQYQSSDVLEPAREYTAIVLPKSEAYVNVKFTDGREKTVLCGFSYTDPRTHAVFQQDRSVWFKRYGEGWIFYLQPGHFADEYQNPAISQMILNAIVWNGH